MKSFKDRLAKMKKQRSKDMHINEGNAYLFEAGFQQGAEWSETENKAENFLERQSMQIDARDLRIEIRKLNNLIDAIKQDLHEMATKKENRTEPGKVADVAFKIYLKLKERNS